jgi:hypothetical protein
MKFFQKQKVDQVGVTSVALQKILVVLMLLSIFTLFNGGLISFLLCLIGFIGAYKRHTGLLRAYVSISVALIIIAFVFALISSFSSLSGTDYEAYSYEESSSSNSPYSSNYHSNTYNSKFTAATKTLYRKFAPSYPTYPTSAPTNAPTPTQPPHNTPTQRPTNAPTQHSTIPPHPTQSPSQRPTHSATPTPSSPTTPPQYPTQDPTPTDSYSYSVDSYAEEDYTVFIFLAIAVMILAFFVVYLKIFSLVLAFRLRKMILTAATTLPTENTQTHEFAPANTSCAVPEHEVPTTQAPPAPAMPFQFSPGFAPYPYSYPYPMMPMMPNNMAGQQAPHHMMFGQQPVFYTYAPVPQAPTTPSDEKL